jgi:SWI/SNF-related matrix-associated actin-dependent regulator of chromatin subfamily A-like protein 1
VRETLETGRGRVWLQGEGTRDAELVFSFPYDRELNDAVRRLPGRWFDWRRKNWRVPAHLRSAPDVEAVLARFPGLEASPEARAWLGGAHRWRAIVSVTASEGSPVFVMRTLAGDAPDDLPAPVEDRGGLLLFDFDAETAGELGRLEGGELDDPARECASELLAGRSPAPAALSVAVGDEGEPELVLTTLWDATPATAFGRLPEAHSFERDGRFFMRGRELAVAVPADPALAPSLAGFLADFPSVAIEDRERELIAELAAEHERARATVELSYAEDASLPALELGGVLRPFQRAGVRYALDRRRTFIADEQGLGKTVQALATLEAERAFPAIVVCPASMKLAWERETRKWLPRRSVTVLEGRAPEGSPAEADGSDVVILNYDILAAHAPHVIERGPQALVLDESHYVKNPRARRTKAALALAAALPDDALRLALTGTPILNRPHELVAQLRVLGRLGEFGSGARLARRFRDAGSNDRLHWNLRAHCYVRRTKKQVLPQLPEKTRETIPILLSNEQEYRLAERDVIGWLQKLPLDLRTIDAKVAAALRAEQLVRLNNLRRLAARGKLPTALPWIADFLQSGEPLVVFADHIEMQRAVLERFPGAARLLGSDTPRARQDAVDAFQREDGPQLIVCSMKAGSQGITLTRASNVAFLELDWTPARHDQAEDRTHRIGQHDAVTAWYLLAPQTIDEEMALVLERKRGLIGAVTDGEVRDDEAMVDVVVRALRQRPYRHLRLVA